jgi:hypothetical protein
MKVSVKVALISALIGISISMLLYILHLPELGYEVSSFVNMFLLMVSVSLGLYLFKSKTGFEKCHYLEDTKVAMQGGLVFTIIMSAFIYIYHSKIDPSIVNSKRAQRIELLNDLIPNEQAYKKLQEQDVTWREKSYLDYKENQMDQINFFISAKFYAMVNLVVGLILTLFFAIFSVIILNKVVLKDYQ